MGVYYAQLKPFDEDGRKDKERVKALQKASIEKKICGMGWANDEFFSKNPDCTLNDKIVEYKKIEHSGKRSEYLNTYNEIAEGDYILTRISEKSECYIGKVKNKAYHDSKKLEKFKDGKCYSWIVDVEEWKPIGVFINIPGILRGLMSSRNNSRTIMSLNKNKDKYNIHCKIIESLYSGEEIIDKIPINKKNFCEVLDPLNLEDLVAKYILKENPGYILMPSTCKTDTPFVEFKFVNGAKVITCQVKNNREINYDDYKDLENQFERIYLFSGIGYKDEKEEKISNVIKIEGKEKDKLFDILKEDFNNKGEFYNELHKYYIIEE